MPFNPIEMKTDPSNWGIFRMMERIEEITERFGPKLPGIEETQNFKAELQKTLEGAPKEGSEAQKFDAKNEDLFAPGTFPGAIGTAPNEIKFDSLISEASSKYDLDSELLRSVIKAESNFNPKAVSRTGAMGLMQLMPGTADSLGVKNPFDPAENIDGGARYLRAMLDRFGGDVSLALSAYNAGPKAVETYQGIPPYKETQGYVKRILGMLQDGG